jgi:hypothetical protein
MYIYRKIKRGFAPDFFYPFRDTVAVRCRHTQEGYVPGAVNTVLWSKVGAYRVLKCPHSEPRNKEKV